MDDPYLSKSEIIRDFRGRLIDYSLTVRVSKTMVNRRSETSRGLVGVSSARRFHGLPCLDPSSSLSFPLTPLLPPLQVYSPVKGRPVEPRVG